MSIAAKCTCGKAINFCVGGDGCHQIIPKDWKWNQILAIADKSVVVEKKTLEWCLSAVQVLKTMLSKHNLTAGVESSEALMETLASALNDKHNLSSQSMNKESEGDEWEAIESSPKDGTHIIGYDRFTEEVYIVWWDKNLGNGAFVCHIRSYIPTITHWLPLPKPPIS